MTVARPISQKDPRASYLAHKREIDEAITRVLEGGAYILGAEVEAFEREFAQYLGVRYAVGVGSGTDALHVALRASGVGPGDAVFTVSHTAVATVAAIEMAGATPVFVDVDPAMYTMDPASLEDAVRHVRGAPSTGVGRPRAVVVVHLYGQPADLLAIRAVAARYDLTVIEDCAQSHGARLDGKTTGAWGEAAAFSFYPTKGLGAVGDGGLVATDDRQIAGRARAFRQYGWGERYVSETQGLNSRLDELQAAILRVKLRHLEADNARTRELAGRYDSILKDTGVVRPASRPRAVHAYHQYVVRAAGRDPLRQGLLEGGVGTAIHYPVPVHLQPAYKGRLPAVTSLQRTEEVVREILSLPIFPELPEAAVQRVGDAVKALRPRE